MIDEFEAALTGIRLKMMTHLRSNIPFLQELIDYGFSDTGKNIRARFMIALCHDHNFDPLNPHIQHMAATIELIHAATLFHDDVIDKSKTRRHRLSIPAAYSNTCSILLGDYCFSKAYMLLKDLPSQSDFFERLSLTAQDLIAGEIWQYQSRYQQLSMTQYYQIIELKTARLFELVSFGLLLLDKTVFPEKISTIARDFGILFQLLDDYFDYFRESKSHQSKALGKDFDEKKMTLPVILALEHDLLRAENFWETESCFDSFLKKITPIESQCRCVINQHYQSLLERTSGMPHTQSIILEAIHAFAPQAIELLSAEY